MKSNQQKWIRYLLSNHRPQGEDLKVEIHEKTDEGLKYTSWQPWEGQGQIDHRSILPNELVLDIDAEKEEACAEIAEETIDVLERESIPYLLADTGGTGYHIHLFLRRGIDQPRTARIGLYNEITTLLEEQDVETEAFDEGLIWAENEKKLVRAIGGRHSETGHRKVVVDEPEKLCVGKIEKVEYPEEVEDIPATITGYLPAPFDENEIIEKGEKALKERGRQKMKAVQQKSNSSEGGDEVDELRDIPVWRVYRELGKNVGPNDQLLCPDHDDTEPSLSLSEQVAFCWGSCGQPGKPEPKNAIDIMMAETDCEFKEAVEKLRQLNLEVDN